MNTLNFTFNFNAPVGQNIAHVDKLEAHFDRDMTMQVVDTASLEASPHAKGSQARLLGRDKPDGAKAHSSGEINLPSSQPMLARIGVATDALSRRPEERGLQASLDGVRMARAIEAVQSFFWAQSAWAVVYCVCRDHLEMTDNMSEFERMVAELPFTKRVVECPEGTVRKAVMRNEFMNYPLHRWPEGRARLLAEKLIGEMKNEMEG